MSKVLLIEDREQRQQLFSLETKIELASYQDILDNKIGEEYTDTFNQLKADTFDFHDYSVVICHKSAFEEMNSKILTQLESHCKANNKVLVLFSGGIDTNYYYKEQDYEYIELNSRTFYSENIELFLQDFHEERISPLILCYGLKWKLNILLNILEKLSLYVSTLEKKRVLYNSFLRDNPDVSIVKILDLNIYSPVVLDRKVDKKEMLKLKNSILSYISESLKYE